MNQGLLFDLDKGEYGLSVAGDGEADDAPRQNYYLVRRVDGGAFSVRQTARVNGTAVWEIEKTMTIDELEAVSSDDAWTWFVRGIKGIPLRFIKETNGQHSF